MEDWYTRLGGGVHADAILDRIIHNVEIVFAFHSFTVVLPSVYPLFNSVHHIKP